MTPAVGTLDLAAYLRSTGWAATGRFWRGARVWALADAEVLVPASDDVRDYDARFRDAVRVVAAVEDREIAELDRDLRHAGDDRITHRLGPEPGDPDLLPLWSGIAALDGLQDLLIAAGRTARDGPHLRFTGRRPAEVDMLLGRSGFGSLPGPARGFTVHLPAEPDAKLSGRDVALHLLDIVVAAAGAVAAGNAAAFDNAVLSGVSAESWSALRRLTGPDDGPACSVGFRWAARFPSVETERAVLFPSGAGRVLRAAAIRAARTGVRGRAGVEGQVDGMHDVPGSGDRWRVRVHGEVDAPDDTGARRPVRAIWIRLPGQRVYDDAVEAYRTRRPVHAAGELTSRDGRVELAVREEEWTTVDDRERGTDGER